MNKKILTLLLSTALAACSTQHKDAHFSAIEPESLLQTSKEVHNFNLEGDSSIKRLKQWIGEDTPTYAEVACSDISKLCVRAKKLLKAYGVAVRQPEGTVSADIKLVYDRNVALDCDQTYRDRPINPYNFTSSSLGCSVSANMVRMVSDRSEFFNPVMRGYMDAKRAAYIYDTSNQKPVSTTDLQTLNPTGR